VTVDLSWLWEALQEVVTAIQDFFNQIWSQVQQISNTGQGLFSGLATLGSALWDAIYKFGQWIWQSLSNIPNAIYSAFQWIYNGVIWIGGQISLAIQNVLNFIYNVFGNIYNAIRNWLGGFRDSINTWFSNLIVGFRAKLKKSIMANISIYGMWKSMEKLVENPSTKTFMLVAVSPFLFTAMGTVVSETIDAMIPTPSTSNIEVMPPISLPEITIPTLTIPRESYPSAPTMPPTPVIGLGLPYDIEVSPDRVRINYDYTTESTDNTLDPGGISLTLESEVA